MSHTLFYRPFALPATVAAAVLFVMLGVVLALSWNSLRRLSPVHDHLDEINAVQEISLEVRARLIDNQLLNAAAQTRQSADAFAALDEQLRALASSDGYLALTSLKQLEIARQVLAESSPAPRAALVSALQKLRGIAATELRNHDELLKSVRRANQYEFSIAALAIMMLPVMLFATLYSFRRRLLSPLDGLGLLLESWAERRYDEVPLLGIDPLLVPLFEHFNQIVEKLNQYESEHCNRHQRLEQQVQDATRTLLEQQRQLANAERLAAIGEVTAGLAHELRNPIASIRMALSNLRRGVTEPAQRERLDMIIGELQRMTQLLNRVLDQAHQQQESALELDLACCVEGLLELVRYQVPGRIRLLHSLPAGLSCRLPEGQLRQALLNLILNAAQSIGECAGTIRISGRFSECLCIDVNDDGPGFPASLLRDGVRSFETLSERGTGLGLSVVRRFAQDLGGTLRLENTDGGACATLELPQQNHG